MALGERETIMTSDGTILSLLRWQGGEPSFVMVHGLASNAELFRAMGEVLSRDGFAGIALDQRGHGLSDKVTTGFDYPRITADLVEVLASMGGNRVWHRPYLIGQSWGCSVVEEFARLHPELTRGTILIDGGFSDLKERFLTWEECAQRLAPPQYLDVGAEGLEEMIRKAHPLWPASGIEATLANLEVTPDRGVRNRLAYASHMAILRELFELNPISQAAQQVRPAVYIVAVNEHAGSQSSLREAVDRVRGARGASSTAYFVRGDHDLHAQFPERLVDIIEEEVSVGVLAEGGLS